LIFYNTNADGLINKRQELRVLIISLKDKPDVIAITEIKPEMCLIYAADKQQHFYYYTT